MSSASPGTTPSTVAISNRFGSWLKALVAKADARQDVASELLEGAALIQGAVGRGLSHLRQGSGEARPDAANAAASPGGRDKVRPTQGETSDQPIADENLRLLEFADVLRSNRPQRARVIVARSAALAALMGLAALVEFSAQQFGVDLRVVAAAQIIPPLMFTALGLRMVQQYGRALQDAQHDRAELERRVQEASAQIERNFAQLADLKVEQVTQQERKRIAADLHDDLGAKLLTIVHTSDNERISTLAREALEEMRLSVRGLTGKPVPLVNALGDWRAEFVLRLSQAGVDGSWHAPADDDVPQLLSARAFVQTTRVLREAVSNIIKHSGASRCTVRCTIAEGDLQVVIQDNGKGIPMELDGRLDRGHGMASMKHRAKQLQGQCLVESGPGYGTVIRLTIPLDRHLASA